MSAQRFLMIFLAMFLLIMAQACTGTEGKESETTFKQLSELQEVKPHKPVKIKLKRNAKGAYSWDISGNNADEIIEADKKLRGGVKGIK
ncbi:MAG: hypothetical protein L0922_08365 [Candidatus Mariimomonas ferrooxydans]